jgi:hypothetical protein
VGAFIEKGQLRIGTAAEYRQPDGKSGARSDSNELITTWNPGVALTPVDANHPIIRHLYGGKPNWDNPKKRINILTTEGAELIYTANAHIYSASYELTNGLKARMASEFDADACVRINDAAFFDAALCEHPFLVGRLHAVNFVSYVSTKIVREFSGNDPFQKELTYRWQREVRFIWQSKANEIKGEIINLPSIVPLLKRLY